jgi:hypothetical protein
MGLKDHQYPSRVGLVDHHLSERRPLRYGWSPVGLKEKGPALPDPEPGRKQESQASSPDNEVALLLGGPIWTDLRAWRYHRIERSPSPSSRVHRRGRLTD